MRPAPLPTKQPPQPGDLSVPTGPFSTKDQRGPRLPPLAGGAAPIKPPLPTKLPPDGGGIRLPPDGGLSALADVGGQVTGGLPPATGAIGLPPASGGVQTAGAGTSAQSTQTANTVGQPPASGGVQTADKAAGSGGTTGTGTDGSAGGTTPTAPVVTIPASQAGPIVDDLSKMQHGGAVSNKPGWQWYHTGAGGWVQAQSDPKAAPGGTAGPPKTPAEAFEAKLLELLNGKSPEEAAAGASTDVRAQAFRQGQQRNQARTRAQLAEENAVGGGDVTNPGMEQAVRGLDQQAGESEGQFVAQLAGQMMQERRAELMQAMQMQAQKGDAEAARATQMQIAQLDAEVRRRGYDVQESLGNKDLDLRKLLGFLGIATDRNTALDRLGFDYTQLGMSGNQSGYGSV